MQSFLCVAEARMVGTASVGGNIATGGGMVDNFRVGKNDQMTV